MINKNYESSPVTCFCIYTPCMLINQHTNQLQGDMQFQHGDKLFMDQSQNNGFGMADPVFPVANIPCFTMESTQGKFNTFASQSDFYYNQMHSQHPMINVSLFSLIRSRIL